tara:strand:- start:1587 stop:2165 length:579 start_codon:yes stop_codon:yes gene_type:complete
MPLDDLADKFEKLKPKYEEPPRPISSRPTYAHPKSTTPTTTYKSPKTTYTPKPISSTPIYIPSSPSFFDDFPQSFDFEDGLPTAAVVGLGIITFLVFYIGAATMQTVEIKKMDRERRERKEREKQEYNRKHYKTPAKNSTSYRQQSPSQPTAPTWTRGYIIGRTEINKTINKNPIHTYHRLLKRDIHRYNKT